MEKEKKAIPSPEQRPDIYDDYDLPPGQAKLSQAYKDRVMPQSLKDAAAAAPRKP